MIKQEIVTVRGEKLIRTYSDTGMYIYGGMPPSEYAEALDPISCQREYTETDHAIPTADDKNDSVNDGKNGSN